MKLKPDPNNANKSTPRGQHAIKESLQRLGAGRSIVADRDGTIIAGNQTYKQAIELGYEPEFVHTSGDRLVVVVRDDLSLKDDDGTALSLALADNRTQELSLNFDEERLGEAILKGGADLTFLWRLEEQEALLPIVDEEFELLDDEDSASGELNRNIPQGNHEDEELEQDESEFMPTVQMRPLAIVLDKEQYAQWKAMKDRMGVASDKLALLRLMDEVS